MNLQQAAEGRGHVECEVPMASLRAPVGSWLTLPTAALSDEQEARASVGEHPGPCSSRTARGCSGRRHGSLRQRAPAARSREGDGGRGGGVREMAGEEGGEGRTDSGAAAAPALRASREREASSGA